MHTYVYANTYLRTYIYDTTLKVENKEAKYFLSMQTYFVCTLQINSNRYIYSR